MNYISNGFGEIDCFYQFCFYVYELEFVVVLLWFFCENYIVCEQFEIFFRYDVFFLLKKLECELIVIYREIGVGYKVVEWRSEKDCCFVLFNWIVLVGGG